MPGAFAWDNEDVEFAPLDVLSFVGGGEVEGFSAMSNAYRFVGVLLPHTKFVSRPLCEVGCTHVLDEAVDVPWDGHGMAKNGE